MLSMRQQRWAAGKIPGEGIPDVAVRRNRLTRSVQDKIVESVRNTEDGCSWAWSLTISRLDRLASRWGRKLWKAGSSRPKDGHRAGEAEVSEGEGKLRRG